MQTIFVYGTLMKKFGNHHLLHAHGETRFVGRGKTADHFVMDHVGFPRARRAWENMPGRFLPNAVIGEVWTVTEQTFKILDQLEGNGFMYQREKVAVKCSNGETLEAWMYLYMKKLDAVNVPHGDWATFARERNDRIAQMLDEDMAETDD